MPGEQLCRSCALITLRAVHSDLEFAAPRDADLPDEGRAYVEHVTTPDPLRKRSGRQEALKPPRNLLWRACRRTDPSERIDRQRERRSIDGRGTGMLACEICSRTSDERAQTASEQHVFSLPPHMVCEVHHTKSGYEQLKSRNSPFRPTRSLSSPKRMRYDRFRSRCEAAGHLPARGDRRFCRAARSQMGFSELAPASVEATKWLGDRRGAAPDQRGRETEVAPTKRACSPAFRYC